MDEHPGVVPAAVLDAEPVAHAEPCDQDARLRPPERLNRGPLDERVVHEERSVACEQHVAHERQQDVGRVQQRARRRNNLEAARVGRKRLWALDAALDLAVERSRQLVAVHAHGTVRVFEDLLEFGLATLDLPGVDARVVAQVDDGRAHVPGDGVTITAAPERVHLFDPASGQRLR